MIWYVDPKRRTVRVYTGGDRWSFSTKTESSMAAVSARLFPVILIREWFAEARRNAAR